MNKKLKECISMFDRHSLEISEESWRRVVQTLYTDIKMKEKKFGISASKVLPELFLKNMTAEQIWQQIEFQNDLVLSMASEDFADSSPNLCIKIVQLCSRVNYDVDDDDDEGVETGESEIDVEDNQSDEDNDNQEKDIGILDEKGSEASFDANDDDDDDDVIEKDLKKADEDFLDGADLDKDTFGDIALESDEGSEDDNESEDNNDDNDSKSKEELKGIQSQKLMDHPRNFSHSAVDSEFFNLRQSEWIADNDIIGENVDDEIDLMEEIDSDEEEGNNLMYNDFFDPPEENSEESSEGKKEVKSKFAAKLDAEKALIRELEEETFLAEKPWVFKGEVQKTERPENSTLEHHLEANVAIRLKPLITEETTKNIENLILSRIRAQAWDDVERKIKPVVNPGQFKQKLILDQEKSKKSLATIYEEEYLKKQQEAEGKPQTLSSVLSESDEKFDELPVHKEIKHQMQDLFMKLDALSNYHFTPKYKPPEVKVVSNLPAISIEECTPATVSDATLLAPQEIIAPIRGELKGETEKEKTDKNRERRVKKRHQKQRAKREEEKLKKQMKNRGKDGMLQTETSIKLVEKAFKKGQIKVLDNRQKSVKSSKGFFSEMQNNVTSRTQKRKADETLNEGKGKRKKGNKPLTVSRLLL